MRRSRKLVRSWLRLLVNHRFKDFAGVDCYDVRNRRELGRVRAIARI